MLRTLARLVGARGTIAEPVAPAFPVVPFIGPVARPGDDQAGDALTGLFESDGWIERVTFLDVIIVLRVVDWNGLAGLYTANQTVFARMLQVRGDLDHVLGALVQVRHTVRGLELCFPAVPGGAAVRHVRAPARAQRRGSPSLASALIAM